MPPLVTEQPRLDQLRGDGRTIDFNERLLGQWADLGDGPGY